MTKTNLEAMPLSWEIRYSISPMHVLDMKSQDWRVSESAVR